MSEREREMDRESERVCVREGRVKNVVRKYSQGVCDVRASASLLKNESCSESV